MLPPPRRVNARLVAGSSARRRRVSAISTVRTCRCVRKSAINFTGQTTLDNGITVGVLVGLNGENVAKSGSTTQVNRAYADFSGKFGLVRVGEANSALVTDCVVDPGNVTSNFGVNSPNESFSDVGFAQVAQQDPGRGECRQLAGWLFLHLRRGAHGLDRYLLRY